MTSQTGATRASRPRADGNARFSTVGVGASAGGLSSITHLLRHLGAEPGVALVVVTHLDPMHASSLVEILAKACAVPVVTATDGASVVPNQVYVVPPNAGLLVRGGALQVTPRVETGGLHLPIDRFFESLAADCGPRAVGVLLSGTGADGAKGIEAIKANGGITFAQDSSAEYPSMPESAVATGCVDFVLDPERIAHRLVRIGALGLSFADDTESGNEAELERILLTLRRVTGVDYSGYKRSTVQRRVERRALILGLGSFADYAERLEQDPGEAESLVEEVLIHVTSFFRDPGVFDALAETVLPRILERRAHGAAIRIWVPGCSTGEEAYSLAMVLLEFLERQGAGNVPLQLFGTDVSAAAIEKARSGRYPPRIENDVAPERLQRFFVASDGAYQIRKNVRDLCVFAKQDVTRDPPFSRIDIISCRNLMIYLGTTLQERLLPVFHYALRDEGVLLLGSSETIRAFPGFVPLDSKHRIYTRTSIATRVLFDFANPQRLAPVHGGSTTTPDPIDLQREADRVLLNRYAPPGVVVTDDLTIVQFRGKTGPFLEPTPGAATFNLLRMLREPLRLPVRRAVDEAKATLARVRKSLRFGVGDSAQTVDVEVVPIGLAAGRQRFFLVLFEPVAIGEAETATPPSPPAEATRESDLTEELAATRAYLESVIAQLEASNEELRAANEEIVSSNEELRSTNEELQMAKEELQATNEELRTVNEQMAESNRQSTRLNDDLINVLNSVDIPIVILDRESRVRRFTPSASKMFKLEAADVGKPIAGLEPALKAPELAAMIDKVIASLGAIARTVQDDRGRWYQLAVRPYLSADNRIDGAVIVLLDIDAVKRRELVLDRAREYAENILDTVRECLVVLDRDLRIQSANRAFLRNFGVTTQEIQGRHLYELGHGEWDIAHLRERLAALGEGDELEVLRVKHEFEVGGPHTFVLTAYRIERTSLILLALEDVTERMRAEEAARRTELQFREMLTTAAEAIVMVDESGKIVFANRATEQLFRYAPDEMLGLPVETLVPETLRARHTEHRARYLMRPTPLRLGREREVMGCRKDGSEVPLEIVLSPMAREKELLVVVFITDITQRNESERKVRDYQGKLQRMAFDAAVAEERERRRIAADLHDRIGQSLALAQIKLAAVREEAGGAPSAAIHEAIELLSQSIVDTRTLTFELSPPVLYDLGLREALAWLAEDFAKRLGFDVRLKDDGSKKPLEEATAALVFRATRELLLNVLKHAQSRSATLSLRRVGELLEIEVLDQGVGFDPRHAEDQSTAGFGLFHVREQITRLGGSLETDSSPGRGTRVTLRVPLRLDAEGAP